MSGKTGKMFQVMEHSAVHELHNYRFPQEITRRLLKYHKTVTVCIEYPMKEYVFHGLMLIRCTLELDKQLS
jgi:hypothetical protein